MISRRYSIFVMVLLAALIVFALPENALSAMKFVKLAEKEKDNFNLSLVYKTYDFILPLWISPQEYALHFPKESKYRPLGKTVPKKVVAYYDLKTNTPKPPTLKRILIYIMGFLLEVIVGSILVISVIVGFVKGLKKYLEIRGKLNAAITRYTEKGGKDNAILKILNYLKRKQKRDLYVCFQCDNQLPNQEKVVIEGVTVHIPFSTFLPKIWSTLKRK